MADDKAPCNSCRERKGVGFVGDARNTVRIQTAADFSSASPLRILTAADFSSAELNSTRGRWSLDDPDHLSSSLSVSSRRGLKPPFGRETPVALCSWAPNIWRPVSYSYQDISTLGFVVPLIGLGAGSPLPPTPLRIIYPSAIDGYESDPAAGAPILETFGPFPVILFAHGKCPSDPQIYLLWTEILGALARAGYIVVLPLLPSINSKVAPDTKEGYSDARFAINEKPITDASQLLFETVEWVTKHWSHSALVDGSRVGLAGHLEGGFAAAKSAAGDAQGGVVVKKIPNVKAYAAVSGGFEEYAKFYQLYLIKRPSIPLCFRLHLARSSGSIKALPVRVEIQCGWQMIARLESSVAVL